jgi:hypothetical protein
MNTIRVFALFAVISLSTACGMEQDTFLPHVSHTQSAVLSSGIGEATLASTSLAGGSQTISGCLYGRCWSQCELNGWNSGVCVSCYRDNHEYCMQVSASYNLN